MFDEIFESEIVTISLIFVLLNWILATSILILYSLNISYDPSLWDISFIISILAFLIIIISFVYMIKGNKEASIVFGLSIIMALVFRSFQAVWGIIFDYIDYLNILIAVSLFIFVIFVYKDSFYKGMFDREFRKAIKLDCAGEEDKALEIYQNLSRKNKDYPILYYYISVIFENSEEHEKALLNVDKSLELKPNYHKALHQKGFILMNLEKYDGALKYTDKALKIKETSQLFINKINILNELKRYNESLKCCDELIKFDPSNEDNYLMKINPLISLNCEKEAFDLVNQILENDENNVYALNNKALIFNSKGNYLNALKYLNKSLSIEEFNPWAVHVKISILIELAKYDEASKCLKKYYSLIDKNSKSEKAWFFDLKRMLYYYSNDYEKALEYSKKTLKLDNCDIDYYLSKIYILKELKYEKELEKCCKYALSLIDEKLKINNNNVTLLLDKVDVYIHLKECDKSIELLKSIEIDVIDKNSFRYKGYLFSQVGRYEEALENYNKSLKIDPENIICLNNKAYALIKLNKFDESLNTINKALEIIPDYWLSLHNKAFALEKLKRYDEALEYYNRAFEINPYDKELQEDRENLLKKIKKE